MVLIRNAIMVPDRKRKPKPETLWFDHQASIFFTLLNAYQNFNTLPRAGGLLDQDSLFVHLLHHALVCQSDRKALDDMKADLNKKGAAGAI